MSGRCENFMSELFSPFGSMESPKLQSQAMAQAYYWQIWDFGARVNCPPVVPDQQLLSRGAAVLLQQPRPFAKLAKNRERVQWRDADRTHAQRLASSLAVDGILHRDGSESLSVSAPLVEAFWGYFSSSARYYSNSRQVDDPLRFPSERGLTDATASIAFGAVEHARSSTGGTQVGILVIEDED